MRLSSDFYKNNALWLAENLLGKTLVRCFDDGRIEKYIITETEAYGGEEDLACHASKGKTARTEVMYHAGGEIYVYLIYGIYWMLNFVSGQENEPQAVLIRGLKGIDGPGRVGKTLKLDKSFYAESLLTSNRIWLEDAPAAISFKTAPRVGIDYAGEIWKNKPWRFIVCDSTNTKRHKGTKKNK
jgi:DNA-3-methyladenine glycosylase